MTRCPNTITHEIYIYIDTQDMMNMSISEQYRKVNTAQFDTSRPSKPSLEYLTHPDEVVWVHGKINQVCHRMMHWILVRVIDPMRDRLD